MGWRDYDHERAAAFDLERAAPDEHLVEVRDRVTAELARGPRGPILDLGAGTGLWCERIVRWTGAHVVAVEPSTAMLDVLARKELAAVDAVQAVAEALPLSDASCAAAWLSTVVHQFRDLVAGARETARVLAPEGVALVRTSFSSRMGYTDQYPARFFPSSARRAAAFPELKEVRDAFELAGLELAWYCRPRETTASNRLAFVERARQRADSLLHSIPDDEFAAGIEAMREWAAAAPDEPVFFEPDLLAFTARDRS
ncbi:class I SAM-dependent methyltransferase [Egibacter rhizosphaerae]|uniref:Class I SAM-dependent methyltransferase n=1 Tax=Egibacter rhizosphaerae TaxID=1670831 RepID=A0A411YEZ0_9ACTN|nr:class I SAM-dependent methyltransferase [Egibacter rhizosphaerae]QBI19780.1 class I SAM-dependent methyltransferase [Egibacter rhizosphaerae]